MLSIFARTFMTGTRHQSHVPPDSMPAARRIAGRWDRRAVDLPVIPTHDEGQDDCRVRD